jgi:hypothetical protein
MRPAHKLLKRLLRHRVWEIDWRQTPTGTLRANLLLQRRGGRAESVPPHLAHVSPLTWLAWHEGHLDATAVTPYVSPELCAALGLSPEERRYFMRYCRDALARLCGLRAADKVLLIALGAVSHTDRRPQDARSWVVQVVWSHRPDLPPATYHRFQQAIEQTQRRMRLLDFQPEMQGEQAQAFLQYDRAWQWYCDGPEPEMQPAYAGVTLPKRFTPVCPRGDLLN